jgi:hypothetical protein
MEHRYAPSGVHTIGSPRTLGRGIHQHRASRLALEASDEFVKARVGFHVHRLNMRNNRRTSRPEYSNAAPSASSLETPQQAHPGRAVRRRRRDVHPLVRDRSTDGPERARAANRSLAAQRSSGIDRARATVGCVSALTRGGLGRVTDLAQEVEQHLVEDRGILEIDRMTAVRHRDKPRVG